MRELSRQSVMLYCYIRKSSASAALRLNLSNFLIMYHTVYFLYISFYIEVNNNKVKKNDAWKSSSVIDLFFFFYYR